MRKLAMRVLVGTAVLLGAVSPTTSASPRFNVPFCPECWAFLEGPGSVDMAGNCAGCGKYPVDLDARRLEWFWCAREKSWRRSPCSSDGMKRCCRRETSLAVQVPMDAKTMEAWYCPAHQSFAVLQIPILAQWRCRVCARPAVKVTAQERAWYWCEREGVWGPAPCEMNGLRKCCAKRDGLVLAAPDAGPVALEERR